MIQFYAPEIETNPVLPETESQHCVKVLRAAVGDPIEVVDGKGWRYHCHLVDAHAKHALVAIDSREAIPLPWGESVSVAIAPTKHNDRMEWLVEKLVEIGINRIIPMRCDHSERKEIKVERLEKIAVSAMKQSLKAVMPRIDDMTPFGDIVKADWGRAQKFIAYCDDAVERLAFTREYVPHSDIIILIGPEGDFSPSEVADAISSGFVPVTLGDNRLRTETAALYATAAIHVINSL